MESAQEMEISIEEPSTELCPLNEEETSAAQVRDDAEKPENSNIDEDVVESDDSKPNSTSLKALSDGHTTLQANLRQAFNELSEKQSQLKDLEENEVRQRQETYLLEERIRLINERLVCLKRCVERKEKKQDVILTELEEAKWKLQEAKKTMEKLKNGYEEMKRKKKQRQEELADLDSQEQMQSAQYNLQKDIIQLNNYKMQLERGDSQMIAIQDGNKMMELEQRKRAVQDAIEERSARSESLYVEIDEKSERIHRIKKSLENAKKQHQDMIRDRKNHYGYLKETELRLQRSLDYLRSKIDYGTYKPAPWPNIRETLKFNNM